MLQFSLQFPCYSAFFHSNVMYVKYSSILYSKLIHFFAEIDGIGEVVGVVTNTSTLVGVSQDGMSQLCSHDDGVTWNSCLGVDVSEITSEANYVTSIPLPFDDFIATSDDTMFSTYGFSHPQFDVTGKRTNSRENIFL